MSRRHLSVVRTVGDRPQQADARKLIAKSLSLPVLGLYDQVAGCDITNLVLDVPEKRLAALPSLVKGLFDGVDADVTSITLDDQPSGRQHWMIVSGTDLPRLIYWFSASLKAVSDSANIVSLTYQLQPKIEGQPQRFLMDVRVDLPETCDDRRLRSCLAHGLMRSGCEDWQVLDADAPDGAVLAAAASGSIQALEDPDLLLNNDPFLGMPGLAEGACSSQQDWVMTTRFPDRPGLVLDLMCHLHQRFAATVTYARMHAIGGVMFAHVVFKGSPRAQEIVQMEYRRTLSHLNPLAMKACWPLRTRSSRHSRLFDLVDTMSPTGVPMVLLLDHAARHNIDLVNLATWYEHAPFSGMPLSRLRVELDFPDYATLDATRNEVARWGEHFFWPDDPLVLNKNDRNPVPLHALYNPLKGWDLKLGEEGLSVCS